MLLIPANQTSKKAVMSVSSLGCHLFYYTCKYVCASYACFSSPCHILDKLAVKKCEEVKPKLKGQSIVVGNSGVD